MDWLESEKAQEAFVATHSLPVLFSGQWASQEKTPTRKLVRKKGKAKPALSASSGSCLVRIESFLPDRVAKVVQKAAGALREWDKLTGEQDAGAGYADAVRHRFKAADLDSLLDLAPATPIQAESAASLRRSKRRKLTADTGEADPDPARVMQLFGRLLWRLYGERWESSLPNLSAARYTKGDFIEPHDDDVLEAYTPGEVERTREFYSPPSAPPVPAAAPTEEASSKSSRSTGQTSFAKEAHSDDEEEEEEEQEEEEEEEEEQEPEPWDRKVALVYYLSQGWTADHGGEFVDLDPSVTGVASGAAGAKVGDGERQTEMDRGKKYLPEFNSVVFFTIPRRHAVLPVRKKGAQRNSIFGWWLERRPDAVDDTKLAQ